MPGKKDDPTELLIDIARKGRAWISAQIDECVSRRDFAGAVAYAGRNNCPSMLRHWLEAGMLTDLELSEILPAAWSMPDWPARYGIKWWVGVFRAAGFVSDEETAQVPDSDLTIYRGCFPQYEFSLSWTTSLQQAERSAQYSARRTRFPPGTPQELTTAAVYRARLAPRHVLALFYGRKEDEVVVNPWGLRQRERIG